MGIQHGDALGQELRVMAIVVGRPFEVRRPVGEVEGAREIRGAADVSFVPVVRPGVLRGECAGISSVRSVDALSTMTSSKSPNVWSSSDWTASPTNRSPL